MRARPLHIPGNRVRATRTPITERTFAVVSSYWVVIDGRIPRRSALSRQMPSACTICTGMCCNGCRIISLARIQKRTADGTAYETVVQLKEAGPFADMTGTSSCSYRRVRGGDWGDPPAMIRSAFRNHGPAPGATLEDYRSGGVGFRVARDLE